MRPVKRSLLPNTVTIYSKFKDPDTGKSAFYRTFLRYVRIMTSRTSLPASISGETRVFRTELMLDHGLTIKGQKYSTEGYTLDDAGRRVKKRFVPLSIWLAATDKSGIWTLQEGDYVVEGECPVDIPPGSESDITNLVHYRSSELGPVFDKDGSIHHWEVHLV